MLHRYSMGSESISPRTPGKLDFREAVECDHADMLETDPRLNARAEVLRREKLIQVDRDIGQGERVIVAGNASTKVPKQAILDLREPVIVREFVPIQPFDAEQAPRTRFRTSRPVI